jgi:hypothetical protein
LSYEWNVPMEDEIRRRLQERKVAIKELAVTHG